MISTFRTEQHGVHLTAAQFGELLDAGPSQPATPDHEAAREHVRGCQECAAELASLREALALFRETTSAYASERLAGVQRPSPAPRPVRSPFSPGLLWAAAGLLVVAGMLPLERQRQRGRSTTAPATASSPAAKPLSDEALLEEVNVALSASVPAAMQPLADPTAAANETTATQPTTTRKN